jgi:MFS family permease
MGMVCPALLLLFVLKGEERERAGLMREVGIIRTMVAEMVPEKELQPRAFSIMPLVWSLGSIFGPSLGGFFAKPAENLSAVFGGNKFLIAFPFVLPNIISSVLFLLGITTGILFLHVSHILSFMPPCLTPKGNIGDKKTQNRLRSRPRIPTRRILQSSLQSPIQPAGKTSQAFPAALHIR